LVLLRQQVATSGHLVLESASDILFKLLKPPVSKPICLPVADPIEPASLPARFLANFINNWTAILPTNLPFVTAASLG